MLSENKTMYIVLVIVGLVIGAIAGYSLMPPKIVEKGVPGETVTVEVPVPALSGTILIGNLIGSDRWVPTRSPIAQMAIDDMNEYVTKIGLDVVFELIEENAEGQATVALEKVQSMVARGVQVIQGDGYSSHMEAIKGYVDENHIVVISHSATSPKLSIDDYIFRLPPTDAVQNKALAKVLWNIGIRHLVVINLADAWGDGGYETIKLNFEALGGTIEEHIRYDAEKTEFSAEAAILNDVINSLNSKYDPDTVAIAAWSFAEITSLYSICKEYPALVEVKWFGSDGFVRETTLVEEVPDSYKTTFLCMTSSWTKSSLFDEFEERQLLISGGLASNRGHINVYDGIIILCKSILEAGVNDGEAVRAALPTVAKYHFGASGWCVLDEFGDRAVSNFELWTIQADKDGKPVWVSAGIFDSSTSELFWTISPP